MTKHTPGPWSVWKFGESSQGTAVGPAQGGLAVAEIVTVTAHGIMTPRSETEGLANARLIAAAPIMFEALQAATGIEHTLPTGEACQCSQCQFLRLRRAAIAKATGGE